MKSKRIPAEEDYSEDVTNKYLWSTMLQRPWVIIPGGISAVACILGLAGLFPLGAFLLCLATGGLAGFNLRRLFGKSRHKIAEEYHNELHERFREETRKIYNSIQDKLSKLALTDMKSAQEAFKQLMKLKERYHHDAEFLSEEEFSIPVSGRIASIEKCYFIGLMNLSDIAKKLQALSQIDIESVEKKITKLRKTPEDKRTAEIAAQLKALNQRKVMYEKTIGLVLTGISKNEQLITAMDQLTLAYTNSDSTAGAVEEMRQFADIEIVSNSEGEFDSSFLTDPFEDPFEGLSTEGDSEIFEAPEEELAEEG